MFGPDWVLSEDVVGVILQVFLGRNRPHLARFAQGLTFEFVIVLPIFKLFFDALADHNAAILRVNGQVASVKKPMKIASHEEPVWKLMAFHQRVRFDMAASRTGRVRSPVMAQRREYASVTSTRNRPWPRRGCTICGLPNPWV